MWVTRSVSFNKLLQKQKACFGFLLVMPTLFGWLCVHHHLGFGLNLGFLSHTYSPSCTCFVLNLVVLLYRLATAVALLAGQKREGNHDVDVGTSRHKQVPTPLILCWQHVDPSSQNWSKMRCQEDMMADMSATFLAKLDFWAAEFIEKCYDYEDKVSKILNCNMMCYEKCWDGRLERLPLTMDNVACKLCMVVNFLWHSFGFGCQDYMYCFLFPLTWHPEPLLTSKGQNKHQN